MQVTVNRSIAGSLAADRGLCRGVQLVRRVPHVPQRDPEAGRRDAGRLAGFRAGHLRDENASSVRILAESRGLRFIGGTGTCVLDSYVTRVKSNHFTEVACYVRGRTSASVIVAAAPTAGWKAASGLLMRAVAAYQAR